MHALHLVLAAGSGDGVELCPGKGMSYGPIVPRYCGLTMALLPNPRWRQLHRWVVPIAAEPLLLTAATGLLHKVL